MTIFFDLLTLIILALTVITGYKKGFLKYILGTVGTIAVVIIAFLATDIFAQDIYESFVQPSVVDYISEKVEKIDVAQMVSDEIKDKGYEVNLSEEQINQMLKSDGDISKEISQKVQSNSEKAQALESDLNEFFEKRFAGNLGIDFKDLDFDKFGESVDYTRNMSYDTVRALAKGDTETGAKYLEQNLVRPFAMVIVSITLFIALYVVLTIVLRIVLNLTGILDYIPVANGINKFLGIAAGLLKGALYVGLIAYIISYVIETTGDSILKINIEIIDKTMIFKYFFDFVNR